MNQKFEIEETQFKPYGESSDLNEYYPCYEGFNNRIDFINYSSNSHIAVKIDFHNLMYGCAGAHHTANLTVSLYDNTTETTVSSAQLKLCFNPWNRNECARVDIPVEAYMIYCDHDYTIRISNRRCKMPMAEYRIRFFTPGNHLRRHIAPLESYIGKDPERFRHITTEYMYSYSLHLIYRYMGEKGAKIPEMGVRLHLPNGAEIYTRSDDTYYDINGEEIDEDGEVDTVHSVFHLFINEGMEGPIYATFNVMHIPVTGLVYSTGVFEEPGTYSAENMSLIDDYLVSLGWEMIEASKPKTIDPAEEARKKLNAMVGLESVKSKLKMYESLVRFHRLRHEAGMSDYSPSLHSMFMGSPGTGKTTVAKIMGALLHSAGVLSKGHVVFCERSTLIGKYYNSEGENTLKALEDAQGGVLFIDEAYQLYQPSDPKDPGKFVLETLLTALADESNRDWMLILAGYTEPMKQMLSLNPGLKSRIPSSNFYYFDDYTPEQLYEIAENYVQANQYVMTADAGQALKALLSHDYKNRKSDFGNARHVINILENSILPSMAIRVGEYERPTTDDLINICKSDIPQPKITIERSNRVGFIRS